MSLAEVTDEKSDGIMKLRVFNKNGICELSDSCYNYTSHDSLCNVNRELAYRKQGLPRCYKPHKSGV